MATPALEQPNEEHQQKIQENGTDLTLCGICSSAIKNPKALPCLHTFCMGCIEQLANGKTDKVTCPECQEDFQLPPEGVSGLKSNFFVTSLKEKKALKEELVKTKPACTFCEEPDNVAIARCLDCKDYLCTDCVGIHKIVKKLKGHKVCSFDDIKSGKVDIQKTSGKEYCSKHEDQVLWFFCDTCGILICRDCTVVDHPAARHSLVIVEEISGVQSERVEELTAKCQKVVKRVQKAINRAEEANNDLNSALEKVQEEAENSATKFKNQFLTSLQQKQQEITDKIAEIRLDHESQIKVTRDFLQMQQSQLKRALHMTETVTESGSPYDLAAMYTLLTDSLQTLSNIKPVIVPLELSEVNFVANNDYQIEVPMLGTVTVGHEDEEEWEMEREFGEIAGLKDSMGIALYPSGDIAIADYSTARVKVFDQKGHLQHNIDVKHNSLTSLIASKPRSLAITSDGTLFVTDLSPYVKVFDVDSKLINQFQTLPPGMAKEVQKSSLSGLARDDRNQVAVGDVNNYYISIHKQTDGTHICSFQISIKPLFIAIAPHKDIIVVSDVSNNPLVVDYAGQTLCTINHPPSPVGITWRPTGASFRGDKEFIIASQSHSGRPGGIYHYSTRGKYLGCVTEDVVEPTNVVITEDGKLVVLEWTHVKVFKRK